MSKKSNLVVFPKSLNLVANTGFADLQALRRDTCTECSCITWTSGDTNVATVHPKTGYVYARSEGATTITATDINGNSVSIPVTVRMIYVSSVSISTSSISLERNDCCQLIAHVLPANASNSRVTWTTSNPEVAEVTCGLVCARSTGVATITATACDGSGKSASCQVTVTDNVLVSEIKFSRQTQYMTVGEDMYVEYSVIPSNAANPNFFWESSDPTVATVNPTCGYVMAQSPGTTTIYARACDNGGAVGSFVLHVNAPVPLTHIEACPKVKTISKNESFKMRCSPNKGAKLPIIIWTSSDPYVASVGTHTGIVTAHADGSTTITASTVDGSITDSSVITVDSREKAVIKKDNHSFYVRFSDGKKWRFIGKDLSKRSEYYTELYPPAFSMENYKDLKEEEQRYLDNIYIKKDGMLVKNTYSVKQIAYLYLLDPIGIEYYMRNHACDDKDIMSGEFLSYKDEVYEAIFGNTERLSGRFYFTIVDGSVRYGNYSGCDRMNVYSNAEIIFGSHTIFNWSSFWQSIGEAIFENIPVISHILLGVEMYQALFYSGSIVSAMSGVASEFLDDYAEETENTVLEKMLGWPKTVFDCFTALADAVVGAFELNNLKDMDIYAKIQEQDYRTVFDKYGSELTIQEIISKCTNA